VGGGSRSWTADISIYIILSKKKKKKKKKRKKIQSVSFFCRWESNFYSEITLRGWQDVEIRLLTNLHKVSAHHLPVPVATAPKHLPLGRQAFCFQQDEESWLEWGHGRKGVIGCWHFDFYIEFSSRHEVVVIQRTYAQAQHLSRSLCCRWFHFWSLRFSPMLMNTVLSLLQKQANADLVTKCANSGRLSSCLLGLLFMARFRALLYRERKIRFYFKRDESGRSSWLFVTTRLHR